MEPAIELLNRLFAQALHEVGSRRDHFVYDATPNTMGRVMERFKELCHEHNISPITGLDEPTTNT